MKITRDFIQLYTGIGKGKSTAALGLALRAGRASAFFAQFVKGMPYSELDTLRHFPEGHWIPTLKKALDIMPPSAPGTGSLRKKTW